MHWSVEKRAILHRVCHVISKEFLPEMLLVAKRLWMIDKRLEYLVWYADLVTISGTFRGFYIRFHCNESLIIFTN